MWNPENTEIWVLEREEASERYGLAGRYEQLPGGTHRTVDIRFGLNQSEPLHAHMKRQLESRTIYPARLEACLQSPLFAHLKGDSFARPKPMSAPVGGGEESASAQAHMSRCNLRDAGGNGGPQD